MNKLALALLVMSVFSLKQSNAIAEDHYGQWHDHEHHDRQLEHHEVWRGNIHRFHEQDFDTWRRGQWIHTRHDGNFGWWWVVDDVWYAYPKAIYPYPDPYTPPTIMVQQLPQVIETPNPSAPNQVWYYCSNPQGYYPYIAECQVPWQKVLETHSTPQ